MKAGFKTGANSTSPNVNWLRESTMLIKEPIVRQSMISFPDMFFYGTVVSLSTWNMCFGCCVIHMHWMLLFDGITIHHFMKFIITVNFCDVNSTTFLCTEDFI